MPRPFAPLALAVLLAAPAAAQTLDEILAGHYAALGGRTRIASVSTLKITGQQVAGDQSVPVVLYWKRPGKLRTEFTYQGETGVQAYDGQSGWTWMPFLGQSKPAAMSDEELADAAEQTDVLEGPLFDWREKGHRLTLTGKESLAGADAWRLELERKSGDRISLWLDAGTLLEVRREGARRRGERTLEYVATTSDWREVAGLRFAFRVETRAEGEAAPPPAAFVVDRVELDVALPDEMFTLPAPAAAAASATP